jgi:hypothetical protein
MVEPSCVPARRSKDSARPASHVNSNLDDLLLGAGAKCGAIPTVDVQGKKRVPWRTELRRLAGDDPAVFEAMAKDFLAKLRRLRKKAA